MSDENIQRLELGSTGRELVLSCTGAADIQDIQPVQTLWSGYGDILRVTLAYPESISSEPVGSVVVKYVHPPAQPAHPRGWHSDTSVARKLRSYQVEINWYKHYASGCREFCPMPGYLASHSSAEKSWLVLEDLDTSHPVRHNSLNTEACIPCLAWLARFHAHHIRNAGEGLWPTGSYWHLQTRMDELNAMATGELKDAAGRLDSKLEQCVYKTVIHGDAKLANMCFSASDSTIAMVDFQYAGRGCGIRDVAYFLGSSLGSEQCDKSAESLVDVYFTELKKGLPKSLQASVEHEWRNLYATAWADFHRFLAGWKPDHSKINQYTAKMTRQALDELRDG